MLSNYFKLKTKTVSFDNNTKEILSSLKNKRVLICGNEEQISEVDNMYQFSKYLSVRAILTTNKKKQKTKDSMYEFITLNQIKNIDYEIILICDEFPEKVHDMIAEYIKNTDRVIYLFNQITDEVNNIHFAIKNHLDKRINYLSKKLKNKKVLFYGAGAFFSLINEFYDLSPIQAIGVVDKKAEVYNAETNICGYKLYSPSEIKNLNPDYIVVTTRIYVITAKQVYMQYLKDTNIKLIPLVKQDIISTLLLH